MTTCLPELSTCKQVFSPASTSTPVLTVLIQTLVSLVVLDLLTLFIYSSNRPRFPFNLALQLSNILILFCIFDGQCAQLFHEFLFGLALLFKDISQLSYFLFIKVRN